ncbi:MAG TPA: ester cyclase [bacterium]|nr:ester cyclase [bacterium]HMW35881.1 ester cyclase [bacterium]HMY35139.1 ester cyclase [bacterium]HMZ04506.1 ester cyclase [bacterium]HNB08283.1 ester cyclase [bacterium]
MDSNGKQLQMFYSKALTVNNETNPAEILNSILADQFVSLGSVESKNKMQLIMQLVFFWKLIPDLKWEIQEIINEGNKYVVRSMASGTPNGDFMGMPTDGTKSFKIMTIDIHTMVGGQIAAVHHLEDWPTAIKQLKA